MADEKATVSGSSFPVQGSPEAESDTLLGRYANKSFVAISATTVRIVLGETNPTRVNYHTAIVMPVQDAFNMAKLIVDLLEKAGLKQDGGDAN